MKLTAVEAQNPVWLKMRREVEKRLQELREKNDGCLTAEETAKTRGSIALCKEILDWDKPSPEII